MNSRFICNNVFTNIKQHMICACAPAANMNSRGHPDPGSKISSSCSSELTDGKLKEHRVSTLRGCPSCGHEIDCNTVYLRPAMHMKFKTLGSYCNYCLFWCLWFVCLSCGCEKDMIGMPAGVKFDPSDQELIHHLETMVKEGGSRAHPILDEFIPTIQGENGICYTHPENLPGENSTLLLAAVVYL